MGWRTVITTQSNTSRRKFFNSEMPSQLAAPKAGAALFCGETPNLLKRKPLAKRL
jgi:hypothetical protein